MKKLILIPLLALFSLNLAAKNDSTATVVDAHVDGDTSKKSSAIGDILVVKVAHWNDKLNAPDGIKQVRLFINSMEIDGSVPIGWQINGDVADVKFLLQRNAANNKTWNTLLGYPQIGKEFFDLPVIVSIGFTGKSPLATTMKVFQFVRIDPWWMTGCLMLLIAYFWILLRCARRTPMFRDAPADLTPLGITGLEAGSAPFSLGKLQMAFWFSIVLSSYLFIWLITDNYELINSGTLVLIGIGAGTALGAVSIDTNKSGRTIKNIQALQAKQADLRQETDLLTASLPAAGVDGKIQYNKFLDGQLTSNIKKLIDGLKAGQDSFLNDILTDENGISFHRLQMVVFTVVLGLVFIYTVWETLTMPDFSATLLTMQGITAGTYLGFKIPEKQN